MAGGVCERGEGFAGYPSSALRYTVPLELWPNGGAVQQTLNRRANDAPNQAGPRGRGCPSPRPPPQNPRGPPALSPEPPLVLTTNYDNDKRHPRWTASENCPGGGRALPPDPPPPGRVGGWAPQAKIHSFAAQHGSAHSLPRSTVVPILTILIIQCAAGENFDNFDHFSMRRKRKTFNF